MRITSAIGAEKRGILAAIASSIPGGMAAAAAGLEQAPAQAWRGDLIMLGGMLSMALYNIASRPLMARSSRGLCVR